MVHSKYQIKLPFMPKYGRITNDPLQETSNEKVKELEQQVEQFKITLQDRDVHKVPVS